MLTMDDELFLNVIDINSETNNQSNGTNHNDSHVNDLKKAAITNNIDLIKELFNKGVDLNTKINRGFIALHYAALHGHVDIVKYLCENGARVNETNDEGLTAVFLATTKRHNPIVTYLCVHQKVDVDIKNKKGWTCLHIASRRSHGNLLLPILNQTKNINVQTNKGLTGLHIALGYSYFFNSMALTEFYKRGANLRVADNNGRTIFDYVLIYQNQTIPNTIETLKFDINEKGSNGSTALHEVIKKGHSSAARVLIKNGAKVDIKDGNGLTPLDYGISSYLDAAWRRNQTTKEKEERKSKILGQIIKFLYFSDKVFGNQKYEPENSINKIIKKHYDKNFLCLFDVDNPHLLFCTKTFSTNHQVCLRCVMKQKFDYEEVLCFTDKCYNLWPDASLKFDEILTLPTNKLFEQFSSENIFEILQSSITSINECINFISTAKEETNNINFQNYLSIIKYPEDLLDIKVDSIKTQIENIKQKLLKTVNRSKTIFKNPQTYGIYETEASLKIIKSITKGMKLSKNIASNNIGVVEVQSTFSNLESQVWSSIRSLEKSAYLNLDFNSKQLLEESKINDGCLKTKHISYLAQLENIMNDLIFNSHNYDKVKQIFKKNFRKDSYFRKIITDNLSFNSQLNSIELSNLLNQFDKFKETNNLKKLFEDINVEKTITETELVALRLAKFGTLSELKCLFEQNNKIRINAYDGDSCTDILHTAIYRNDYEMVAYLLDKCVDLNVLDDVGRTYVQVAAINGCQERIQHYLISKGCPIGSNLLKMVLFNDENELKNVDVKEKDNFEATVLHYIAASGKVELLKHVSNIENADIGTEDKNKWTCLERSLLCEDDNVTKEFIEAFEPKEYSFEEWGSILMKKALLYSSSLEIIDWLFWKFTSLNKPTIYSNLAISIGGKTSELRNKKIEYMLDKGANFKVTGNGENFLKLQCERDFECLYTPSSNEFLDLLINNGLELEEKDSEKHNIYHIAAMYGNFELIKMISNRLPNNYINEIDEFGYTPIMYAIANCQVDIVKWLLPFVVSVFIGDDNLTILDYAISWGFQGICNVIKDYGIESNLKMHFNSVIKIDEIENTAIFHFNAHKIRRISEILLSKNHRTEMLIIFCLRGSNLRLLFEYQIPFEKYIDNNGANIAHIAAAFGRNDILLWLFINKFNLEATDKLGLYPLAYAALNCNKSTVLLLNMLGMKNMYKQGTKPFLNICKYVEVYYEEDTLNMILEEIKMALETLNSCSTLLTAHQLQHYSSILQGMSMEVDLKKVLQSF